MNRFWRIVLRLTAALVLLTLVLALTAVLVFRSGWFQEAVHARIVAELERATGARVEIGNFAFDWEKLEAKVAPLVLHGKEQAGESPLLRAESVTVGLKIISALERKVDLASLVVDRPQVRIVFYPDGTTNIPEPQVRRSETIWTEDLIQLAVRRYEITGGVFEYDDRKIPLNIRGEDLSAHMNYETRGIYQGEFASRRIRFVTPEIGPMEADASAVFIIDRSKIEISRLRVATKQSRADLKGTLTDLRTPRGTFDVKASLAVPEAVKLFSLPVDPSGSASFDGKMKVSFATPFEFDLNGRVNARGLGFKQDRIHITGAQLQGDLSVGLDKLTLRNATAEALDAKVVGEATLSKWKEFHAEGTIQGLHLEEAAHMATDRPLPWSAKLAGGFTVDAALGKKTAKVQANIGVYPVEEARFIEGHLDVAYDQAAGTIALGNSYLTTAATRVDFLGDLGRTMQVRATSTNLDDLLPALALAGPDAPKELPLKLQNGRATLEGTVEGSLDDPHFAGNVTATNGVIEDHAFDSFRASVNANRRDVHLSAATLTRGATTADGQADIVARNGAFDAANIDARINLHNAQLAELAKETGANFEISGTGSATAHISGTIKKLQAEGTLQAEKLAVFGEQADRVRVNVRYANNTIEVSGGDLSAGAGRLRFQGSYQMPGSSTAVDWKNGEIHFDIAADNLAMSRVKELSDLPVKTDATLTAKLQGTGRIVKGEFVLVSANGDVSARNVTLNGEAAGDASFAAQTRGNELSVRTAANLRGTKINGEGSWRLEGDYPGSASIQIPRADLATLHSIIMIGNKNESEQLPFEGFVEGSAKINVALRKPETFSADVTLNALQVNPKATQALKLGVQAQDVVLKNTKPVVVTITAKEARIKEAQFAARDTSLEATGGVPFDAKASADLVVRGSVNLAILQLLNPDLLARGNATVQASLRGSIRNPQMNGRMELKNASLYLNDLPNGVDSANGVVLFDRNRATIEKLTAETGGGKVNFSGFVEFGGTLLYRLQADAQNVRVRYPEDVSVTFNATLALNGTSDASTLSGSMSLNRAAFNPRADFGSLLAQAAKPAPAPASPNDYLRGMQFDVRIESGPNFEFQTSLTRDLEAEVDLRLRGTPIRPVLLGSISVNQGEIQVFGNKYTVNRGDIRFLNPVKIDPSFDVDLETKVRAITVNISVSGTMQKLNVNYSSDPPLQSREIFALLTVGRDPTLPGAASAQATDASVSMTDAGGGLLGQAVSAQLNSRLQRFFGASRVKIDPSITGVDSLPQARLTLEQQISKEVTLTYITNLNRTQEQIVQVQWDFSKHWSAVAVRNDNGIFAIDFQYRKRFK